MSRKQFGRHGFVKTLEMFLAVAIIFIFLIFAIPQSARLYSPGQDLSVLEWLSEEEAFRQAVLAGNSSYINSSIRNILDENGLSMLNFTFSVSSNPNFVLQAIPAEQTISYSMFISAEGSSYSPKILRIYAWKK